MLVFPQISAVPRYPPYPSTPSSAHSAHSAWLTNACAIETCPKDWRVFVLRGRQDRGVLMTPHPSGGLCATVAKQRRGGVGAADGARGGHRVDCRLTDPGWPRCGSIPPPLLSLPTDPALWALPSALLSSRPFQGPTLPCYSFCRHCSSLLPPLSVRESFVILCFEFFAIA